MKQILFAFLLLTAITSCNRKSLPDITPSVLIQPIRADTAEMVVLTTPYVDTSSRQVVFYEEIPKIPSPGLTRPYVIRDKREGVGYIKRMPGEGVPAEIRVKGVVTNQEQNRRERKARKENQILTAVWSGVLFTVFGVTVHKISK